MTPEESLAILTQHNQNNGGAENYAAGIRTLEVETNRISARKIRAEEAIRATRSALTPKGRPSPDLTSEIEPLAEELDIGDQIAKALGPVVRFTSIKHDRDGWRPFRFMGVIWEEGAWAELGDDLRAVLNKLPKPSEEEIKAMATDGRGADDVTKALMRSGAAKVKARAKWLSDRGVKTARSLVVANPTLREPVDSWDAYEKLLATPGGVLDLRTGQLVDGPAVDRKLTRITTARWTGPDAQAPQWQQFLKVAAPDDADRDYLQLIAGTFLIGSSLDHAMYLLLGPESTGKGTFAESVMSVLGDADNGIAVVPDPKLFSAKDDHSTALTDLRGRRMAWIDEVEFGGALSEAKLKRITGGGKLTARKMYQNNATAAVTHTILITSNAPLRTTADPAVWRRLRYIGFDTPVDAALSVATKAAAAGEEGPGILAWAVEGARRVLADRDILKRLPPNVKRLTQELNGESNHVAEFVETMTQPLPEWAAKESGMTGTVLRAMFNTWCRDHRYPTLDARTLGKRLRDLQVPSQRGNIEGEKHTIYRIAPSSTAFVLTPYVPPPAEGGSTG